MRRRIWARIMIRASPDAHRRLALMLKTALRRDQMRCTDVREVRDDGGDEIEAREGLPGAQGGAGSAPAIGTMRDGPI